MPRTPTDRVLLDKMPKMAGSCTALTFYLVHGSSTIIVGLDVGQYATSIDLMYIPYLEVSRPQDKTPRRIETDITSEIKLNPESIRMSLEIVLRPKTLVTYLI